MRLFARLVNIGFAARLPPDLDKLLNEIKKQARSMGLDTQKFVRIILESSLRKKAG